MDDFVLRCRRCLAPSNIPCVYFNGRPSILPHRERLDDVEKYEQLKKIAIEAIKRAEDADNPQSTQ